MDKWHYSRETVIEGSDVDAQYHCKMSRLFHIVQETATEHSILLEISREHALQKYNCFWMILRVFISLKRPLTWHETLRTEISMRRPLGSRLYWDCDFYVGDEWVGEATPVFVLVNRDSRKPVNLEALPEFPQTDVSEKHRVLGRITFPEGMELYDVRRLYYSDADMNGHINNARYVDLACDTAQLELRPKGAFLQEITISYIGECFPGETLRYYRAKENGVLYIHGVGADGSDRFDCKLRMSTDEGM